MLSEEKLHPLFPQTWEGSRLVWGCVLKPWCMGSCCFYSDLLCVCVFRTSLGHVRGVEGPCSPTDNTLSFQVVILRIHRLQAGVGADPSTVPITGDVTAEESAETEFWGREGSGGQCVSLWCWACQTAAPFLCLADVSTSHSCGRIVGLLHMLRQLWVCAQHPQGSRKC